MRRAAIYARVSTDRQTAENQLQKLKEVAERAGWRRSSRFMKKPPQGPPDVAGGPPMIEC